MGSAPDLTPGTIVGDYRIDQTIGTGGMGAVYQATQPLIGKKVAIKVLHRALCENTDSVQRFIQEARAVNTIGHPNIVDVFGFGTTDDGRAFLVMELLVGETLSERRKRDLPLDEACAVLIEIAHALEAAHAHGIVHRDLKPDNVFLATRPGAPAIKLLDFGIAKLTDERERGGVEPTRPGILIGTPRYISPEQVRGRPLDGRTDIYALGVVAYELFTGRVPFTGSDSYEIFEKHVMLRPPKPSAFNARLPAEADALILALLDKDPDKRPGLPDVRAALAKLRDPMAMTSTALPAVLEPTVVHAARRVEPPTEILLSSAVPTGALTMPRRLKRRRLWIAAAAVVTCAAGGGLVLVASGRDGETPAAPRVAVPIPVATPTATPTPIPIPPDPIPIPTPKLTTHAAKHPKTPHPHPTPTPTPTPPPPLDKNGVRSPFEDHP